MGIQNSERSKVGSKSFPGIPRLKSINQTPSMGSRSTVMLSSCVGHEVKSRCQLPACVLELVSSYGPGYLVAQVAN